jgi:competence protein ComEC
VKLRKFFLGIFCFLFGIFIRSFFVLSNWFVIAIFFSSILALFSYLAKRRSLMRQQSILSQKTLPDIALWIFLALFMFWFGVIRYSFSERNITDIGLEKLVGKRIQLIGVIAEQPEQKISTVEYIVAAQEVVIGTSVRRVNVRIIASAKSYQQFLYGDLIKITGVLTKPQPIVENGSGTKNGDAFDYPAYLSLENVYYQVSFPSIALISPGHGNRILGVIFSIKKTIEYRIESQLPEPHAALLEGILLGDKKALGNDLENEFRAAGVIHIVILSGYSINIITSALGRVLTSLPLPRIVGFFLSSLGIVFFALMTGASSTVVRASMMALLLLFANSVRRDYHFGRALAMTVFLMVLYNPKILVFDVSFQISLLSVIGLAYFSPFCEKWFSWVPERFRLRETVVSTVSTQIFVLPFILHEMGEFSIVSVPVNIAVLFLLPFTMLMGLFASLLSCIHWIVAWPFSALTYFLLQYMLAVVHFASSLPFSVVSLGTFPWWLVVSVYIFYGYIFRHWHKRPINS